MSTYTIRWELVKAITATTNPRDMEQSAINYINQRFGLREKVTELDIEYDNDK